MKTYSIIAKTNSYIANRDLMFNGSTEVVLKSNLSLKEAHSILLDMFNEYYSDKRGYAVNWGLAYVFHGASLKVQLLLFLMVHVHSLMTAGHIQL